MSEITHRTPFIGRLRQLGYRSYKAYLRSEHWRSTRERYRSSDVAEECYCCGAPDGLHLHHKTYERLGSETLDDLVWLCGRCHQLVHVLERRGDLPLNLAGLLDAVRARRYAAETAPTRERAAAEYRAEHAERERREFARTIKSRLTVAVKRLDADEIAAIGRELEDFAASLRENAGA